MQFHLQPLKVYVIFYVSSCEFAIKADFFVQKWEKKVYGYG